MRGDSLTITLLLPTVILLAQAVLRKIKLSINSQIGGLRHAEVLKKVQIVSSLRVIYELLETVSKSSSDDILVEYNYQEEVQLVNCGTERCRLSFVYTHLKKNFLSVR